MLTWPFILNPPPGREKHFCTAMNHTLQPLSSPPVLKHRDRLYTSGRGRGLKRSEGSFSNTCFTNFLLTWPVATLNFNAWLLCHICALIYSLFEKPPNILCHSRYSHFSPWAICLTVMAIPVQSLRWIARAHMVAGVHSCIVRVYGDWVIRLPAVIRQSRSEV